MNENTVIHLRDSGSFAAFGVSGVAVLRYIADDACWRLSMTDSAEENCADIRDHESLDLALIDLASSVSGTSPGGIAFKVRLPCGTVFSRPGRLDAEAVLGNLGYIFVSRIAAAWSERLSSSDTIFEATRHFRERLGELSDNLGRVSYFDQDDHGAWWCGDVSLPVDGYIHRDSAETLAAAILLDKWIAPHPGPDIFVHELTDAADGQVLSFASGR